MTAHASTNPTPPTRPSRRRNTTGLRNQHVGRRERDGPVASASRALYRPLGRLSSWGHARTRCSASAAPARRSLVAERYQRVDRLPPCPGRPCRRRAATRGPRTARRSSRSPTVVTPDRQRVPVGERHDGIGLGGAAARACRWRSGRHAGCWRPMRLKARGLATRRETIASGRGAGVEADRATTSSAPSGLAGVLALPRLGVNALAAAAPGRARRTGRSTKMNEIRLPRRPPHPPSRTLTGTIVFSGDRGLAAVAGGSSRTAAGGGGEHDVVELRAESAP